jgi:hypothetical protein
LERWKVTLKSGLHTLGENQDTELYGGTASRPHDTVEYKRMGPRNGQLAGYTDRDTGPNTENAQAVKPLTAEGVQAYFSAQQLRYLRMLSDQVYDRSHPVDEFGPPGSADAVVVNNFTIQPDYDMPERIEEIAYSIPVGCTFAAIQLGQRYIVLYSGAALAVQLTGYLKTGVILNATDNRNVIMTGALTTSPYVGLSGFALTRGQFS